MEKMVMSWKYWACLALTGAAVVLVFGEPSEWLNGYQWWTQFALQKAAGAAFAVAAWKVAKDCSVPSPKNKWRESLGKAGTGCALARICRIFREPCG